MLIMVTDAINLEEQLANIKGNMETFSKESKEKDAQIKRQNKQIADLTRKLGNRSYKAKLRLSRF